MKKSLFFLVFIFISFTGIGQELTWAPSFPTESTSNLVITVDATKGNKGLLNYTGDVYVHIGVITNKSTGPGDWKHVLTTWGTINPVFQAASLGNNKWSFTISSNLRSYFSVTDPTEKIQKIAILFRDGSGTLKQANTDGSDMYVPVYTSANAVTFTAPPLQPTFVPIPEPITKTIGDNIPITAIASNSSAMTLYLNGTVIQTATGATTISATPTLVSSGNTQIVAEANDGVTDARDTINFFVSGSVNVADLPAGARDGINYINSTTVTLVLYAPGEGRVAVIGDLPGNNWTEQSSYQMNKTPDGNRWWITISGLTPGTEYSFQYLVNGTLRIADPYSEKILDPDNDQFISSSTYPNLKPYPTGLTTQIVGILQTNQPQYNWAVSNFARPDKRNLIIYELLVRDFVANHNWNTLRDTLNYLKNLGVNAIELLPFNEFDGNISWGYNPDFYFAPDKYYGPENTLKEFIDSCHKNGMAVIMDIALNHSTGNSPLVRLYFDATNNRPAINNPWYNPVTKHAYTVGYDMNHESPQTHYIVGRILSHWLNQYKIDGFRFDLSKGFTQTQTCDNTGNNCNVAAWGNYDQSRINILEGYYDTIQNHSPGAYSILEHFADNSEETVLSNYGMLLWGNESYNYQQASMGYSTDWDFSWGIANQRGWSNPYLDTYAESHDEERLMYKNLQFGNSFTGTPAYNIKVLDTALQRQQLAAAFLFTIPGPKMLWQFGELGYDYSINYCQDGTINSNCRTDPKPIRWDYFQDQRRREVYNTFSYLIKLRKDPAFSNLFVSNSSQQNFSGSFKWIILNPPSSTSKLVAIGNFDVTGINGSVTFPSAGKWYDYLNGTTVDATGAPQSFFLKPGEFHIYTNLNVTPVVMVNFSAIRRNGHNLLTWTVATEKNVARYEILRSEDGASFESIGEVQANGSQSYNYVDNDLVSAGVVYYKLRIVDIDGSISYSEVRTVKQNVKDFAVKVLVNPFQNYLKLNVQSSLAGKAFVSITGIQGKQLISEWMNVVPGQNELQINQTDRLSGGVYFVKVEMNNNTDIQKVIKY